MKHINRRIMQYQVIVLDLDGTLTNSKKEITEKPIRISQMTVLSEPTLF